MRKAFLFCLAMALIATAAPLALAADEAAENQPVVVLSFSGYAELKRDLGYLGTLAGNPRMADGLEQLLLLFTQGQGLGGVDQARPWGASLSITSDASQFPAVAFVPVSDFDAVLETLAAVVAEPVDAGDDIYEIRRNPNTYFLTHQGDWLYVAQQKSALADLPADPLKQLRGLNEEYDLAVSINMQNIPQALRDMAADLLMQGMETKLLQQMDEDEEDDDEDAQASKSELVRGKAEELVKSINELDQVTVGLNIDRAESRTFLDLEITALAGSDTARSFAEGGPAAQGTRLGGVLKSDAVLALHANLPLTSEDRAQSQTLLQRLREYWSEEIDEEEDVDDKTQTKQLVGKLLDIIQETIDEEGRINAGLVFAAAGPAAEARAHKAGAPAADAGDASSGQYTAVLGGVVANAAKLEEVVKQFIALAEYGEARLNAEKHKGHRFHVLSLPVPEDDDDLAQAKQMFGDPLKVVLAFGKQTCFVAFGQTGLATIKQVIDRSQDAPEENLPPMTISLGMAELLKLSAAQQANPAAEQMAASLKTSGKDHLKITVAPVDNGLRLRLEGEEGINKLLGSLLGNAAQPRGR